MYGVSLLEQCCQKPEHCMTFGNLAAFHDHDKYNKNYYHPDFRPLYDIWKQRFDIQTELDGSVINFLEFKHEFAALIGVPSLWLSFSSSSNEDNYIHAKEKYQLYFDDFWENVDEIYNIYSNTDQNDIKKLKEQTENPPRSGNCLNDCKKLLQFLLDVFETPYMHIEASNKRPA